MLKKTTVLYLTLLKTAFAMMLIISIGATLKNLYLSYHYNSFSVPISAENVYQLMGKPDAIDEHPTENEYLWVYNKTFLPSYFMLTVKNNVVIEKYEYVSP